MNTRVADVERGRGVLRPALIAAAGVVAVVVAIGLNYFAPENPASEMKEATSSAPSSPQLLPPGVGADMSVPVASFARLPSFDVVRINPRGEAVIAGRAEPGAAVVLRDGDGVLGEVNADGRGEWVFVPDSPLAPGSHRLELEMRLGIEGVVASTDEVIIIVPRPGEDVAGRPMAEAAQPLALRQPRSGGPAVVMQAPASKSVGAVVSVDTADAGGKGWLVLTGRAPAGARVRVSMDGRRLSEVVANGEGQWHLRTLQRLDGNRHGVSVELLDTKGTVADGSSVPLPLGNAAGSALPPEGRLIVQRGENLWRIARTTAGRETAYTIIYDANSRRIAEPHLIHPGQVFQLPPDGAGSTEAEAATGSGTGN